MSFIDSLKNIFSNKKDKAQYLSGFQKTRQHFGERLNTLGENFSGVNDEFLEELTIILLESDVGIDTADLICEKLKEASQDYPTINFGFAMDLLLEIMKEIYEEYPDIPIQWNDNGPTVIFLEGVNGSGKTTTAAKLAKKYTQEGKKVAFCAADTFRAGAIAQLASWGEKLNIPTIKGIENGDPSAAIVDGCRYAVENNIDLLICDTAGRLQNKISLMNELAKMNRVTDREISGAPHNTWLVLDATTGQNGLSQAEVFNESTNLSGIILTKMDGTAKGGIILAIKNKLHLPVYFIGLGEQPDDLRPFDLDSYLYSISEGLNNGE